MAEETETKNSSQPKIANPLHGIYPQKQNQLFMQRIKVPGGRISWPQWRKIAHLATLYSPGSALHITTRQDIELHNIFAEDLADVQKQLADVTLTTLGAGGDSIRNITVCPGCGLCPNSFDLMPMAQLVQRQLELQAGITKLPRKFKISFSGCGRACAKPWLSDLGFIAQSDQLFTVVGAGSLGAKPALGIELYPDLPAEQILGVCIAAVQFFSEYGDRENRRRARLRHVRERLGDDVFQQELDNRLTRQRPRQSWPEVLLPQSNKKIKLLVRLQLPNGNLSPKAALQLADIAEPEAAVLRIGLEHNLELYGPAPIQLPDKISALAANPIITACPGTTTCPKALVNCWAIADDLRQALLGKDTNQVRINISGCPNNCAHSAVADIGLVGVLRKQDGKPAPHCRLLTGGGNGRNDKLGKQIDVLPVESIAPAVKNLLKKIPKNLITDR